MRQPATRIAKLLLLVVAAAASFPALVAPLLYLITASACRTGGSAWCPWLSIALSACAITAWVTYFRMGLAWVSSVHLAKVWPLAAAVAATASVAPLYNFGLFIGYLAGPVLALQAYLVFYHLHHAPPSSVRASA